MRDREEVAPLDSHRARCCPLGRRNHRPSEGALAEQLMSGFHPLRTLAWRLISTHCEHSKAFGAELVSQVSDGLESSRIADAQRILASDVLPIYGE